MEKIKDAIGLGAMGREGQEPVSGEQGAGTATEPYDAGNREDHPALGGKDSKETDGHQMTGDASTTAAADSATSSGNQ